MEYSFDMGVCRISSSFEEAAKVMERFLRLDELSNELSLALLAIGCLPMKGNGSRCGSKVQDLLKISENIPVIPTS